MKTLETLVNLPDCDDIPVTVKYTVERDEVSHPDGYFKQSFCSANIVKVLVNGDYYRDGLDGKGIATPDFLDGQEITDLIDDKQLDNLID